jgi:hypothetical protein
VTQSNAANAEQSAAAALELNAQGEALKEALSKMMQLTAGAKAATEIESESTAMPPPSSTTGKPQLQHSRHVRSTKPSPARSGRM